MLREPLSSAPLSLLSLLGISFTCRTGWHAAHSLVSDFGFLDSSSTRAGRLTPLIITTPGGRGKV
ncbi:hypothetical protein KCP74_05970 [Salmonella enterica subsp. enterica]|nr:hypothetical protein KCP74_05970 [Salmonella enterica subsp. enterica]